jgi:hypothetical protein
MSLDICKADGNIHIKTVKNENKMISACFNDLTQETCDEIPPRNLSFEKDNSFHWWTVIGDPVDHSASVCILGFCLCRKAYHGHPDVGDCEL